MAKDKLVTVDGHYDGYSIAWWLADEQDIGGTLGDGDTYTQKQLQEASKEDRPHILACLTAAKTDGVIKDRNGFRWASLAQARAALKVINLALKNDDGAPWPDWALKAKAAGWTAPKGWKP